MTLSDFISRAITVPFLDHGRDFNGWDCWGIIVRAFQDCFGIVLESFEGITGLSSTESERLFENYRNSWIEIELGKEKVGDAVVMRGGVVHVGLVVSQGMMLHAEDKLGTCVETYLSITRKKRIIGIYRHAELAK